MNASSVTKDEGKRPCYRCEYCYLCIKDRQSIEEHLKNCLSTPDMTKVDTYFESYMKTLQSAMLDEKEAFDGLLKARTEANNAAKRFLEALQRRENAEKAYENTVDRDIELCTAGLTDNLILSDAVKRKFQELEAALNDLRSLGKRVKQALHELKDRNCIATFAANKMHLAFFEAVKAYETTVTCRVLVPGADQALQDIESTLKSRCSMLTELQNSIRELETAISQMEKSDLKEEDLRILENVSGRDLIQNAMKRKSRDENDKMDTSEENVDDPKPSASGIRNTDIKSEETKKISCSRRLSFS